MAPPQWHFIDRHDAMQGPFTDEEMRAWYEAGYLNDTLRIHLSSWGGGSAAVSGGGKPARGGFRALGSVFPDGTTMREWPPDLGTI